jgi:hypothetical protein
VLVLAGVVVLVGGTLAAGRLEGAIRNRVAPSADAQLALLRAVPHPAGAVEIGHRLENGSYRTKPTAWLTYRTMRSACPAALATFATAGADQVGPPARDEVTAYCQPPGSGFESFCIPHLVCFFADFSSDHDMRVYTISTGPDGEG